MNSVILVLKRAYKRHKYLKLANQFDLLFCTSAQRGFDSVEDFIENFNKHLKSKNFPFALQYPTKNFSEYGLNTDFEFLQNLFISATSFPIDYIALLADKKIREYIKDKHFEADFINEILDADMRFTNTTSICNIAYCILNTQNEEIRTLLKGQLVEIHKELILPFSFFKVNKKSL